MVILLALTGMICWGVTPVFVKLGLKGVDPLIGLAIRTAVTTIMLTSWIFLNGSYVQLKHLPSTALILLAIEAIVATFIGDLAYFAAIKRGSVSLVAVIMACSPLITIICSTVFLGEQVTVSRVSGAILIIAGIFLAM